MLTRPYSSTTWIVKPGLEDEFVRRWSEFADWSSAQGLTAAAMLLRDMDERNRFVSFGPWESIEAISRWRSLPGFQERVMRLHEVLERFEPHTLELLSEERGRRRWLRHA